MSACYLVLVITVYVNDLTQTVKGGTLSLVKKDVLSTEDFFLSLVFIYIFFLFIIKV